MKPRPIAFLFLVFFEASRLLAQDAATTALTLDQAVRQAQANRPLLQEAAANLSAAASRVGQARSAYLPSLDTALSWQRVLPQQQQSTGAGFAAITPPDYWNFTVGAREVIWDFGKREGSVALAQSGVRTAQANLSQLTSELTYQTIQTFWAVVYGKEELASLEEQHKDLLQHLNSVEMRTGTGSGTKYDVLNTQVRVTSLEGQKIETLRQLTKQRLVLARLTGQPLSGSTDAVGVLEIKKITRSATDLKALALESRADLEAAQAGVDAAESALRSSQASWTPDLSASAAAGFQNPILTSDNQDLSRPMPNASLGLTLSLGLNPAQVLGKIGEAQDRLEAARQALASVKEEVGAQVERAYEDYLSSLAAWENAKVKSDQARQALEAAQIQYELGVIPNDTYLNSHLAYEQAQLSELQVLYSQLGAYYALGRAVGVPPAQL